MKNETCSIKIHEQSTTEMAGRLKEILNSHTTVSAEKTIRSALTRKESRGAHQRKDFPDFSKEFNVNIQVSIDENNDQELTKQPVSPVSSAPRPWLEEQDDLPVAGRLLE